MSTDMLTSFSKQRSPGHNSWISRGQRSVIQFLPIKGVSVWEIGTQVELIYKADIFAFLPVKDSRKPFAEGRISMHDKLRPGRVLTNDVSSAISFMLKETPFMGCKVVCRHFHIAEMSDLWVLPGRLGAKKFNCSWVSHGLGKKQKVEWPIFYTNCLWCYRARAQHCWTVYFWVVR
jgi:hypothetical protein